MVAQWCVFKGDICFIVKQSPVVERLATLVCITVPGLFDKISNINVKPASHLQILRNITMNGCIIILQ